MRGPKVPFSSLLDQLVERGWAVTTDFPPSWIVRELAEEAHQLWRHGKFRPAGIGRGREYRVRRDVRGDLIFWWDEHAPTPVQRIYWAEIERLRQALNEALFLGLVEFEVHYAVFPPGAFYRRHRDRFLTTDERMISCILYLNAAWSQTDGGALRIYAPDGTTSDILPHAGTFVLLRSDAVEHEVLPTRRERFSVTGWFRRRARGFQLPLHVPPFRNIRDQTCPESGEIGTIM
jgi:SM-20-related protein